MSSSSSSSSSLESDFEGRRRSKQKWEREPLQPQWKRHRLSYDSTTQVCFVCYFSATKKEGYDIIVSDLDSIISAASSSTRLPTTLRFVPEWNCSTLFAFCGLGWDLYLFESEPMKSVYKIDLRPYHGLRGPTVELGRNDLCEVQGMFHSKSTPYAVPTPDGKKVLVFSSLVLFKPRANIPAGIGENDFELYDAQVGTWQKLPGIRHDWREYSFQHPLCDFIRVQTFTFIDDCTFFMETTTGLMFSIDVGSIDDGWRKMDTFFGASSAPANCNDRFLVVEERLCITPWIAYDIKHPQSQFELPLTPFTRDIHPSGPLLVSPFHVKNGTYHLCSLQTGIRKRSGYPYIVLNLSRCNLSKYTADGNKELSQSMTIGESVKFFLDDKCCRAFFALCLYSITA